MKVFVLTLADKLRHAANRPYPQSRGVYFSLIHTPDLDFRTLETLQEQRLITLRNYKGNLIANLTVEGVKHWQSCQPPERSEDAQEVYEYLKQYAPDYLDHVLQRLGIRKKT